MTALKDLNAKRIYGVVGIPGDRLDESAIDIGCICAKYLDYVIVKEDKDLRGRKEGKIAELIVSGILKENKNKKYEVIFDEQEALIKAISMARSGDTIVVFFEQMNPLVKIIEEFNSFYKENEELRYNALK